MGWGRNWLPALPPACASAVYFKLCSGRSAGARFGLGEVLPHMCRQTFSHACWMFSLLPHPFSPHTHCLPVPIFTHFCICAISIYPLTPPPSPTPCPILFTHLATRNRFGLDNSYPIYFLFLAWVGWVGRFGKCLSLSPSPSSLLPTYLLFFLGTAAWQAGTVVPLVSPSLDGQGRNWHFLQPEDLTDLSHTTFLPHTRAPHRSFAYHTYTPPFAGSFVHFLPSALPSHLRFGTGGHVGCLPFCTTPYMHARTFPTYPRYPVLNSLQNVVHSVACGVNTTSISIPPLKRRTRNNQLSLFIARAGFVHFVCKRTTCLYVSCC